MAIEIENLDEIGMISIITNRENFYKIIEVIRNSIITQMNVTINSIQDYFDLQYELQLEEAENLEGPNELIGKLLDQEDNEEMEEEEENLEQLRMAVKEIERKEIKILHSKRRKEKKNKELKVNTKP